MNARTQITLDPETQRRARAKAADLGISFAEYIRRLVAGDLGAQARGKPDISILFDLVDDGRPTDIARDKDRMIGEAVWEEHLRKTSSPQRRARRPAKRKR
jgi:hypothetical protein